MSHVIVLLPGIAGSILKKNGMVAWGYSPSNLANFLLTGGKNICQALALPYDPPDVDDLGDGVVADALMPDLHLLPGFWKIDGYSKVTTAILGRFEVAEGENFFHFPYDWRRDNRVSAWKLAQSCHIWLKHWREKSGNDKARLILVAHSMGGLVSRYFLEVLEGWKLTEALITFGTPYRGSLNALNALSNGLRKGNFNLVELTALARQFTSIYQLLPIFEAYDPGDGTLKRVGEVSGIPHVNDVKAADALKFHREIEAVVNANRQNIECYKKAYRIYPVVGIAQETYLSAQLRSGTVTLLKSNKGEESGGDGTVPRVSAIPIELQNAENTMFAPTPHGSLQNTDSVLVHIEGILSGTNIDLGRFRKEQTVALQVEDLFWSDEPIVVQARPTKSETNLLMTLYRSGEQQPVSTAHMVLGVDGWHVANLNPLPFGTYRAEVTDNWLRVLLTG